MRNLKFPEIDKKIQQSVYGAWGGSNSNEPPNFNQLNSLNEMPNGGWYDNGDGITIISNGSGGSGGYGSGGNWDYGDNGSYDNGGYWGDPGGSGGGSEYYQEVTNWTTNDFFDHYHNGNGEEVSLTSMGLRDEVIASDVYLQMMTNVNNQIENFVHDQVSKGSNYSGKFEFTWDFNNVYDFTSTSGLFAIGRATISGVFLGSFVIDEAGKINVNGTIDLDFHDRFEDPWDIINLTNGSWDPTGVPYDINDSWQQQIQMEDIRP
ncbi:hypothetical protein Flavo103_36980 [Flavobacterium collinsii]|uniref:hypothetical protein n=1 Tax=Flavobacterium collinsii TaxID=1114861 RepID=UPI0022C03AEE|nr:hypothetical protein [Flavobacterium collinsii]GIQ60562.1 hypothetical protein Flavo103_36980 [Flavobacterium collinsii]